MTKTTTKSLYVLATVALVGIVTLARWLLNPVLGTNLPFVLYFPIIIVVAWFAGPLCAFISMLLSMVLAAWLFIDIGHDPLAFTRLALLVLGGSLIVYASHVMHRSRNQLILAREREGELRRYYQVMLDSIAEGVIATDRNHRITYMNEAAIKLTEVSLKEAIGQPLLTTVPLAEEGAQAFIDDFERLRESSARWQLGVGVPEPVPIAISLARLQGGTDTNDGEVLVLRLAFDDRERSRLVLAADRARGEAEAANRMKDDFLRMVSHELRAPLNAILGWADVMLRKNDLATIQKGCDTIRRNVRAQSSLIDSMLDVAAIASGKFLIARRSVDINELLVEAHRSIEPLAQTKAISLVQHLYQGDLTVSADPARLLQVLANLYSNALKFTPSGGTISTRVEVRDQRLLIEVIDSGQGMSEATLALVFERSDPTNSTLQRSGSGLGLGLRIARRITELHGGQLLVASNGEGQGARMSVLLPLHAESSATPG